jgi:membrane dipeptidase
MLIVDAHLDLGTLAVFWDRDITRSAGDIRQMEAGRDDKKWRGDGTVGLPDMRKGRVAVSVASIWTRMAAPPRGYCSREIAYAIARAQLEYYRLLEAQGQCRLILTRKHLEDHMREWRYWEKLNDKASGRVDVDSPKLGFILSIECADPILNPEDVAQWWKDGVRLIGPAHADETFYVYGNRGAGGLKPGAASLLSHMRNCGMVLDTTHMSDQTFRESLDLWDGPVVSSHANCRAIVPGELQHNDWQIRTIMERGGVMGIAMASYMLSIDWEPGRSPRNDMNLGIMVDHIDHICQIAGNARQVGIGSDLDGAFGRTNTPYEIDTIADLQKLSEALKGRGYKSEDIENIMHGNWLRYFTEHLPEE